MNRRQFLGTMAAGLAVTPMLGSVHSTRLPTRKFGRTGLKVPILAFGAGSRFLMYEDEDKALEALSRALDLGITYVDTAHAYGDGKSEERIGRLMPSRRAEVILATKIPGRTADQARREIELSLKRLRTDHLEVRYASANASLSPSKRHTSWLWTGFSWPTKMPDLSAASTAAHDRAQDAPNKLPAYSTADRAHSALRHRGH